jgi:hypothetical protein
MMMTTTKGNWIGGLTSRTGLPAASTQMTMTPMNGLKIPTRAANRLLSSDSIHPFKEVVFLHHSDRRGIAYHLDCSNIQDMGALDVGRRSYFEFILMSFPYTPCWMAVFPENN